MKRFIHRVKPSDNVQLAAQKMREHDIGFLPVCDEADRVVGVLTDRDIVLRACADDKSMSATLVESVMSPDVIACRPAHGIRHAEALMRDNRKSRIVVTDADRVLLGVISFSDIAQYETSGRIAETLTGISSRKYDRG